MESGRSLDETTENIERQLILSALSRAGRVQLHAARLLGITEQSPWYRIKKYAIHVRVAGTPPPSSPPRPAPRSLRPAPLGPSN